MSFGTTVIYDNAEFNLLPRDHVGIVGVNGAGKTTLFKVLIGAQLEKIKNTNKKDKFSIAKTKLIKPHLIQNDLEY